MPKNSKPLLQTARVIANAPICVDHHSLLFEAPDFPESQAGQFVHLGAKVPESPGYAYWNPDDRSQLADWFHDATTPLLRRAYSITELHRSRGASRIRVMYRVVGAGTRWLQSLQPGDAVSVLGPLGEPFPIHADKRHAWLVAGGIGLPPLLWLAEHLMKADVSTVAFCGAQRHNHLPLDLDESNSPDPTARSAVTASREFARFGVSVIISTDDGSLGFRGHVGQALQSYHDANPVNPDELVVYTCGPERMMRAVADHCASQGILCYVCMERAMACGLGTCQSCVTAVQNNTVPEGWSYALCCIDGPVFDASTIIWDAK